MNGKGREVWQILSTLQLFSFLFSSPSYTFRHCPPRRKTLERQKRGDWKRKIWENKTDSFIREKRNWYWLYKLDSLLSPSLRKLHMVKFKSIYIFIQRPPFSSSLRLLFSGEENLWKLYLQKKIHLQKDHFSMANQVQVSHVEWHHVQLILSHSFSPITSTTEMIENRNIVCIELMWRHLEANNSQK